MRENLELSVLLKICGFIELMSSEGFHSEHSAVVNMIFGEITYRQLRLLKRQQSFEKYLVLSD